MIRSIPLILALTVLGACGPTEPPLNESEIRQQIVVEDLLLRGILPGGYPSQATHHQTDLDLEIQVPPDAELSLVGALPRKGNKNDDRKTAEFLVRADDVVVFSREIEYRKRPHKFDATVDLSDYAGKTVELHFEIRESRGKPRAHWRRAILGTFESIARRPASDGPNLLFVLVDTLRADHSSVYGYKRPTTPFLESFADQAVVFDHAVAQAPWTMPSVATIMTGTYPTEHGVVAGTHTLSFNEETTAEILQRAGFSTFAVSANPLIAPKKNYDQGFETMSVHTNEPAYRINEAVLSNIDRLAGHQWFGYVHYMDPHTPYNAPAPAGTAFADPDYEGIFTNPKAIDDLAYAVNFGLEPPFTVNADDLEYLKARYDGDILFWDRAFEELIADLDRRGLLENTIIIVTSDHGEEFLEHGMVKHGPQLYHESIHVPLLVRVPPGLPRRSNNLSPFELKNSLGLVLRLLDVAKFPDAPALAELSDNIVFSYASPALEPKSPWPRQRIASLMTDGWKLIRWLDQDREELYRMTDDSGETTDLAANQHDTLRRLSALLDERLAESTPHETGEGLADEEDLEQLRALGYLE